MIAAQCCYCNDRVELASAVNIGIKEFEDAIKELGWEKLDEKSWLCHECGDPDPKDVM